MLLPRPDEVVLLGLLLLAGGVGLELLTHDLAAPFLHALLSR